MIKVERSFPAPISLSEQRKYDGADVVAQLRADFNDKCYICGMGNLQDPQIEHLLPHKKW